MSQLEDRAKPIVEALFSQEPIVMDSNYQAILGAWSVKNAMVFEALQLHHSWYFLATERTALKETLQPPTRTSVWIAKCVEHQGAYCSASDLAGITDVSIGQVNGYVTTMGFGPLAIQVLNTRLAESITPNAKVITNPRPGPWDQATLRIWPVQQAHISWPPSIGLSGEIGLQTLSERWNPGSE